MSRTRRVVVFSAAERRFCEPLVAAFEQAHPDIAVDFRFDISTALHERYLAARAAREPLPDVLWSSAMDLQLGLAYEGDAQPLDAGAWGLPPDAVWNDCVVATTSEPVVTLARGDAVREPAGTPAEIARLIARDPAAFRGRVAVFDIEKNGLGNLALLAEGARDPAGLEAYLHALEGVAPRAFGSNPPLVEEIASGRAALGAHVLAAYARRAAAANPALAVADSALPPLAIGRLAFVPRGAVDAAAGRAFVRFLVTDEAQSHLAAGGFDPLRSVAPVRRIALDEHARALVDPVRRAALLARWRRAVGRAQ